MFAEDLPAQNAALFKEYGEPVEHRPASGAPYILTGIVRQGYLENPQGNGVYGIVSFAISDIQGEARAGDELVVRGDLTVISGKPDESGDGMLDCAVRLRNL